MKSSKRRPSPSSQLSELSQSIADTTTLQDIQSLSPRLQADGHSWWVLVKSRPHTDAVIERLTRAESYLDLRGLLIRHPEQPLLVRFKTPDA